MLWKIYKIDPDVCHYIFGTMHITTDEAYTFAEHAKKHIRQCARFVAEMDLNESANFDMMQYFLLPEPQKINDFFRPKQYEKFRKLVLKVFDVDLNDWSGHTPFFISNMLAELSLEKQQRPALDHYLWQYAMGEGKEMSGVESLKDQINILQQIPLEYQIKSLKDALSNIKSFRKKLNKLNSLYGRGDYVQLYKSSKKSMGKIRSLMIYDRNKYMSERIVQLSQEKSSFFAVGAAHLAGDKGLISLLKKQGFKLRHIPLH